ncbi:hypothetical protein WA158_007880 [Blastocystis sp. Blastoise]
MINDIRNDILHFEQLIGDLLGILSASIRFCVHSSDSINDILKYYVDSNIKNKNTSKVMIQECSFLRKSNIEKNNDDTGIDYIRFTSKGPIYCIPKRIINSLVGSYIYEQFEEDQRTIDGTLYLDYPYDETMVPLLIDSLMNKKIDLTKYKYKDIYELFQLFEYCGLPLPEELIYTYRRSKTKYMKYKEGDQVTLYINGIKDIRISNYLVNNGLWNRYINQYKNGFIDYEHMNHVLYMDKKYKYIEYIYQYITNECIFISNNDMLYINKELLENEMYELFGDKGREEAKEGMKRVEYFKETTIISNKKMENYVVNWFGKEKKWKLLFRASEHEYKASEFHKYCDNKGETITIIKQIGKNNHENMFGAYTYKSANNPMFMYNRFSEYFYFNLFTLNNESEMPATKFEENQISNFNMPKSISGPCFNDNIHTSGECHSNNDSYCSESLFGYINKNKNNNIGRGGRGGYNQCSNSTIHFIVEDYEIWERIY